MSVIARYRCLLGHESAVDPGDDNCPERDPQDGSSCGAPVYVRRDTHQGAVEALAEVERILRALDAQYATLKYLPATEPRAQVLEALAVIERGQ